MPGPPPNRSGDLSRERDANRGDRIPLTKGTARPVTIPEPDENWHPIAQMIWASLLSSGQSDFYQDSDWAYAYHTCEELSNYKQNGSGRGRNGQILATIDAMLGKLLIDEASRRRARIELEAPADPTPGAEVAVMEDYRNRMFAVPDLPVTD